MEYLLTKKEKKEKRRSTFRTYLASNLQRLAAWCTYYKQLFYLQTSFWQIISEILNWLVPFSAGHTEFLMLDSLLKSELSTIECSCDLMTSNLHLSVEPSKISIMDCRLCYKFSMYRTPLLSSISQWASCRANLCYPWVVTNVGNKKWVFLITEHIFFTRLLQFFCQVFHCLL